MWILSIVILFLFFCLWAIIRYFSTLSFDHFNAFGDEYLIIRKTRVLAVCALVLCTGIDYFLSVISPQYIADWKVNVLVGSISGLVLLYTYYRKVNVKILDLGVRLAYLSFCGIYIYRAYVNDLNPVISTEVCLVFIYSLLVFSDTKNILLFVCYILLCSGVAVYASHAADEHKSVFISAVVQAVLMLFMFSLIESRKLSRILFSDTILNNSRQFIYVVDLSGKVVFVNKYMASELGLDTADILNDGWWDLQNWNPDKRIAYKGQLVNNIKTNTAGKGQESFFSLVNNRELFIEWRETPIESSYMLMVGEEITEELRQKEELEKLSLVAKSVTNGIVITDTQHRIEWVNESFLKLMNYSLPELIGKRPIEVFSGPNTDEGVKNHILKSGLADDIEIAQYTRDGAVKWLLINNSTLKDDAGSVVKQVEIITDITERKRLERRFSYILQNAGDIIYTSDIRGHFDFINDTVTSILGYLPEELLGWHFTQLICDEDKKRVEQFYYHSFKNKVNDTYLEFRVLSKAGKVVWVSQTVNFIFNEKNEIEGLQAIVRDITPVKTAELERQKKDESHRLFSGILASLSIKPFHDYGTLENFFRHVSKELSDALKINRVSIWFLEEDKLICHYLHVANEFPDSPIVKELHRTQYPVYFKTLGEGSVIKAEDVTDHPAMTELAQGYFSQTAIKSMMDVPILLGGQLIGIVCCEEFTHKKYWVEEEENFAKSIADLIAINLEANKRREVEKAIKESENNFRQLNETIDDVFWLYDLIEHRILYVSPSSEKILGIHPQEFYKTDNYWVNYILDEDKPLITKAHETIERVGFYEVEYRIRKPDGKIHWIYEKSFGIKDETGKYVKSSGLCSDVTSRKESQALIEKLSLVAEKTTNSIIITNNKEEIVWVNQAFEKLTGYRFDEVVHKNPSRLLQGKETSEEARDGIREILESKHSGHVEIVNYNKDNQPYWVSLQIDTVFDVNGECIYYISVESEITTQKLAALALKESKEQLDEYARSLEFQDAVKGKLIHSQSVDDIVRNVLSFLKHELPGVGYLSMFVMDEKKQNFIGKRFVDGQIEGEAINIKHAKSYQTISSGEVYIERDLSDTSLISESDGYLIGIGMKSYIILPLMSFSEFIGALVVAFENPYQLSVRQEGSLRDLITLLSVSIRQIMFRDKVFEHNKDLNDSLKYAQNIQASILPFNINRGIVHDTFILYLPKAHVSGDFYWLEEIGDYQFIVVGDCTGHGVPGAFLTLLANSLLQKNIVENRLISPAAILENIDREIYTILNRSSDRLVRDGMELAISVVNSKERTLTFAGAGLGLTYFTDEEEPLIIRGNPVPIGDYKSEQISFSETVLQLKGNEQFFMNSDGYQDQLGGTNNKRLSKKVFLSYLAEIRHMYAEQQQTALHTYLKNHQRDYSQTDDITVLGFKVTQ